MDMDMKMDKAALSMPARIRPEKAWRIIRRIFRGYPGNLAIRLGRSETMVFGQGTPACTLVFNRMLPLRRLALFPSPLNLADAYFRGWVDIEGDIYSALELRNFLHSLDMPIVERALLWLSAFMMGGEITEKSGREESSWRWSKPLTMAMHSRSMNREAIGFHYDVSNEFYRLWLDERMVYSCAYFKHAGDSLETAQKNKLDLICRKLRLSPGERLLDIGCGWGALAIWAAKHYGVKVHGVTLSRNQYDHAVQKVREEGLEENVTIELRDYRDIAGAEVYDKVSSVGMFEHVGLRNLPAYFSIAQRLLKPNGLFLNHGITQDEEGTNRSLGREFISRYVFPDGELDLVSNILRIMERSFFEIHDVESLRPHYALTLRQWVKRLERHHEEVLHHVSETVYRVWRLYMAGCALQFENGEMGVYQILAVKRSGKPTALPLTRSFITGNHIAG
jgi:cyclopropane-fatty-acyl-phospholipid synthase